MLTKEKLFEIFPHTHNSKLNMDSLIIALNAALKTLDNEVEFITLRRQAAFLAQCGHESAEYCAVIENLNYSSKALRAIFGKYFPTEELATQYHRQPEKIANRVYASRMGNGDEASGDGWKYRGRGLIQLTGKNNYTKCGEYLCYDLLSNPEYLETPMGAVESALWFWTTNNLNTYADSEDIRGMTKRINGGYNGLDERLHYYEIAKESLTK